MMIDAKELEDWANAYTEAQSLSKPPGIEDYLWWPIQKFFDLEQVDPESIWSVILLILEKTSNLNVMANLAAGPLEDLIAYHGAQWIDRIEIEARRNPKFRVLLGGVWESGTVEVWERLKKVSGPSF